MKRKEIIKLLDNLADDSDSWAEYGEYSWASPQHQEWERGRSNGLRFAIALLKENS